VSLESDAAKDVPKVDPENDNQRCVLEDGQTVVNYSLLLGAWICEYNCPNGKVVTQIYYGDYSGTVCPRSIAF
jgi:hypothetical protein